LLDLRRIAAVVALCALPCFAAAQGRLLVAVKGEHRLAIVDPATGSVIASIPESGITGHEVAASPDGKLAFVPIYGNSGVGKPGTDGSSIDVIDLAARKIAGNIAFDHGVRPHCAVFGPKNGLLYVTTELNQSITIIDPKTLKIVGAIPTGQPESHMLALAHNGLRGYTANVGPGTVSVLDMRARKVIKIIPISGQTQRISISNDDKWVFTADQTQPRIAVIDTATDTVAKWVAIDGRGYGSAPTRDGRWLLMTIPEKNEIAVVGLATMKVARTISTPPDPEEVIVTPDGKSAWVSFPGSNQVAEIDLATGKVTKTVATGKASDGLAWVSK
jgi:DNA-binding beta-propeller fold protein YncE